MKFLGRFWWGGLAFGLALGVVACGREITGLGAGGRAVVVLDPVFPTLRLEGSREVLSVASIVEFTSVRIVLLRANGETAIDTVVSFPADSASLTLQLSVRLGATAPPEGEGLNAALRFVNAAGDTVFSSTRVPIVARPPGAVQGGPPPSIPLTYTGPGANAASVRVAPDSVIGRAGETARLTAEVRSAQGAVLASAPVAFTSTDTTKAKVGLSTGVVAIVGVRGRALVIAQTLTGQGDTVPVVVLPVPSGIALTGGGGQQVRQGAAFPTPLRFRVTASDALPVPGAVVSFEVTQGQGLVSAAKDTADADGVVEVRWTAGDVAGQGVVIARVDGQTLSATATGTQLSSAPTTMTFGTQPIGIVAGDTLPPIVVQVRDATGDTAVAFGGAVRLVLSGGAAGARLQGDSVISAVAGVARFRRVSVDRSGTGYRLVASLVQGATGSPTATSSAFDVTAAPAAALRVLGGDAQVGVGGTALTDSIRFEVLDRFGFGVGGVEVKVAVDGGGSVSPAVLTTGSSGRVATRWTVGSTGPQRLTATVGALSASVTARIPAAVTLVAGGGQSTLFGTSFATPVRFRVTEAGGAALAGIPVAFTATRGGRASPSVYTSDAAGDVITTWIAGDTAGVATLTATVVGMPGLTASASGVQATPLPVGLRIDATPSTFTAGDTIAPVVVRVLNGLGDTIPTFTGPVRVAVTGGTAGATLLGTTVRAAVAGVARFPGLTIDRGGTGYRLVALADSVSPPLATNTDTFTVSAAPAVRLAVTAVPATATSGLPFAAAVTVEARDRFGFVAVGTRAVTVALASGTGTLVGPTVASTVDGVATFAGLRIDGVGPHRLVVSTSGLAADTTVAIAIVQRVAALAVRTQPAGAVSNEPFATQPVVELRDHAGLPVRNAPDVVVVSRASGTGTVYGPSLRQGAQDGVVTFSGIAIEGSGPHALRFALAAADTIATTSASFDVAPGPVGIRFRVGAAPTASATAGDTLTVPLQLNFDNRGGDDLASLSVTVTWDPARFAYLDEAAGRWVDDLQGAATVLVNTDAAASGRLVLSGFTNEATTATFVLRTLRLRVLSAGTGPQTIAGTVSAAGNAAGVAVTVLPRALTISVAGSSIP